MPKVYFHDIGFRNALLNQLIPIPIRQDQGAIAENYAFIRLRTMVSTDQIHFWRTTDGHEIDFVVNLTPNTGYAMGIKSDIRRFRPSKYSKFTEVYPKFPLTCRALIST